MKKNVTAIFGGDSSEHEISCISAKNIVNKLNKDRYEVHLVGIEKNGTWHYMGMADEKCADRMNDEAMAADDSFVTVSLEVNHPGMMVTRGDETFFIKTDVWFPVLHGKNGEDGTIQGLFEMTKIPYVGCGVLASSASMDKISTKLFADRVGVAQARFVADVSRNGDTVEATIERVERELGYPVFVKPSNAGSSKGVSKAHDRAELVEAIRVAKENDHRILIEEFIDGREVECAVLGGDKPKASKVGEILSAAEFYDFDAKYNNSESKTIVDPEDLPDEAKEQIREDAVKIFKALDGFGLARVDFFVKKSDGGVIFNEINTLPGFTNISMYPMLWEAVGVSESELLDKLIEVAYER
ncbi:MAG: D-alanine--D-alanine ligase [Eubacterium sp.]|nr:D-alanine--D-alanine ligase [Eubacterium sp.]